MSPIWSSLQEAAPFDRLVRLAVRLTDAPMAMVSLERDGEFRALSWTGIPEPWASTGEMPQPYSFCDHVMRSGAADVISDTGGHPRLVKDSAGDIFNVAAYLGLPLRDANDRVVGVFAVMDTRPREWTPRQVESLQDLALSAITEVELRARTEALERAQAEQREGELRFRQLAENIQEAIWIAELDPFRVLYVSPGLQELYGRDMSPIYQDPYEWMRDIHPDDLPRVQAELQGGTLHEFSSEFRIVRPDGQVRWLYSRGFPVRDERGEIYRVAGLAEDVTERKEQAQALEEREARLRDILESITDSFLALDEEWRFTYLNREARAAVEQRIGRHPSELIGERFWDVMPDMVGTVFEHEYRRVMAERSPAHFEAYYAPFDTWSEVHAYPSSGGGISIYFRDVTDRKRMEATLRESERRLSSLLSNLPGQVYRCLNDPDWTLEYVSEGVKDLTGYDPEDLLERKLVTFAEIIHPDDRQELWNGVQRALEERRSYRFTYRIRTRQGSEKWVMEQGRGVFQDDTLQFLEGIVIDVTERRQAEEALRESEERFRQLAENIRAAFWIFDPEFTRTLYVSPAYEEIWGESREGLLRDSRYCVKQTLPEDRARLAEAMSRMAREQQTVQFRIRHPSGEIRWLEARGFPVRNESGEVYRIAGLTEDVTERRRAREQTESQLREKSVLLEEVHHRVKNNLQIISSLLNIQIRSLEDPTAIEALRQSQSRTRAIALVHETLYRSGDFARIDLADYLRRLAQQIQRSSVREPDTELSLDLEPIWVPLGQAVPCGLIMSELVTNALKHAVPADGPGRVHIELRGDAERERCTLVIADNGSGFPEAVDLDRTRSVGLQLVRILSEQIRAEMEVSAEAGTAFSLTFPILEDDA